MTGLVAFENLDNKKIHAPFLPLPGPSTALTGHLERRKTTLGYKSCMRCKREKQKTDGSFEPAEEGHQSNYICERRLTFPFSVKTMANKRQ